MSKSRTRRDDDNNDLPWSEERWETFMKEGDLRAARYGELLETLLHHPDRDELVAREMGWDELADEAAEEKAQDAWRGEEEGDAGEDDGTAEIAGAEGPAAYRDSDNDGRLPADAIAGEWSGPADPFEDDDDADAIPAYALAHAVGKKIHDALKPWLSQNRDEDDPLTEPLGDAFIGCHVAAAKVAGGHAMGYDDDVLCGNIVNCRRGLAGAEQAIRGLEALRGKGLASDATIAELLSDARRVRDAVRERIEELRARVWW